MKPILIDIPEVITTPRLILQMPKAHMGQGLYEAMLDGYEDYVEKLSWDPTPPTAEEIEIHCRKHHAEFILRGFIRYIIIEKSSNLVIGRCALPPNQINWKVPQFEIAYFVRRSMRGKGYASEAAHALTLMAFEILKAKKVEIYADADNLPSSGVAKNLNFKLEYKQRGGWPRPDGQLAHLETYSMFTPNDLPELEIEWG